MKDTFMNYSAKTDFRLFFDSKGYVGALAEKSVNNIDYIHKNPVNLTSRLFYFAVGHKFKNLPVPASVIFRKEYDEGIGKFKCTDFVSLQEENFDIIDDIKKWIENIRNLNSHYVHLFKDLTIDKRKGIALFLKDAFRMATMVQFLDKEDAWLRFRKEAGAALHGNDYSAEQMNEKLCESYVRYISSSSFKIRYKRFLYERFRHCNRKSANRTNDKHASSMAAGGFPEEWSIDECLDDLLFTEVRQEIEWKLYGKFPIMHIGVGTYISFIGMLFLLSIFLYKDEANLLISTIKGYKRHDDDEMRSKRNIMSFFSKKLSSQDYDSEEKHLIYFRDIVQYLNKYPTEWNKETDLDNEDTPLLLSALKEKIEEMEIDRLFPDMQTDTEFKRFAIEHIFRKKRVKPLKDIYWDLIEKNSEVGTIYRQLERGSLSLEEYEDANFKAYVLKYVLNTYFLKKNDLTAYRNKKFKAESKKKYEAELNINKEVKKLKERLEQKLFYTSYGRNQDRFMEMAVHYLAKEGYFGQEVQFQMYQFKTLEEQIDYLEEAKVNKSKKDFDKQKFHKGKLTYYASYSEHCEKYPEWDTPFVIENNAIKIKLKLSLGERIVSIQRPLLVYLLQEALFPPNGKAMRGDNLLKKYYSKYKDHLRTVHLAFENKDVDNLSQIKKLLPRKAVKRQFSDEQMWRPAHMLYQILEKAQRQEKRYEQLLKDKRAMAQSVNSSKVYDLFIQKNKGKQFKLQFIRKAWNIMYFKDVYLNAVSACGQHRKSFHITRDEYNDFCRYLFAMDSVPDYKTRLRILLDGKGFLTDKEFKCLFDQGQSLDDYYRKTKEKFREWIERQQGVVPVAEEKYRLENYNIFAEDRILYINLSNFISFLKEEKRLEVVAGDKIILPALANKEFLISDFYTTQHNKESRSMCKKLMTNRLEDCLLYELAIHYLRMEKNVAPSVRKNVGTILNSRLVLPIEVKKSEEDKERESYHIKLPFNQIEKYVGILSHKMEKEKKYVSFLSELPSYMKLVKSKVDEINKLKNEEYKSDRRGVKELIAIRNIYAEFLKRKKIILLEEYHLIQKHLVTEAGKFLSLYMELEKYFVYKMQLSIANDNRITFKEILLLHEFVKLGQRNTAFHFGVPQTLYSELVAEIELQFITKYIKPLKCKNYWSIPIEERSFMDKLLKNNS